MGCTNGGARRNGRSASVADAVDVPSMRGCQTAAALSQVRGSHSLEKVQWQPIETAPKDGTLIIGALIDTQYGRVCRVHDMKHNGLAFYTVNGQSLPQMTHWMPMPDPPQVRGSHEGGRTARALSPVRSSWVAAWKAKDESNQIVCGGVEEGVATMKIEIEGLTEAQAIAIEDLLATWAQGGSRGCSRWTNFYADGDGNFRPRITVDGRKPQFQQVLPEGRFWTGGTPWSGDYRMDFDSIAWKLRERDEPSEVSR